MHDEFIEDPKSQLFHISRQVSGFKAIFGRLKIPPIKKMFLNITMLLFAINSQSQHLDSINYFIQNYDYLKTIDMINKTDIDERDYVLLSIKASAYKGLSKYQEAISCYQKILNNDSANLKCNIDLALCYQLLGDNKNACALFEKALILDKKNYFLIQQLANSYFFSEDFENALLNYLKGYSIDSSYYLTKQIAKCYEELSNIDTAIIFYEKAIEMNSNDFLSTYRLTNIYRKKENYEHAIKLTNSYLNQDSLNLKILRLQGLLLFLSKDFEGSIKQYKKCLTLNDTSELTNKFIGYSYFKFGDFKNAKYYLEQAYLKNYLDMELCYLLGLACNYSDDFVLGAEYLNRAIDLSITSPLFLSQVNQELGRAYTNMFEYELALSSFLKAYDLTPNDVSLIYKIARHYDYCIKDKTLALKYYNFFLVAHPKKELSTQKTSVNGELSYSNYESVLKRIDEIKEDMFWQGKNSDTISNK